MDLIEVRIAGVVVTSASQGGSTAGSTVPVLGHSSHVECWHRCMAQLPGVHTAASRPGGRDHHRAGHAAGLLSNAAAAVWTACAAAWQAARAATSSASNTGLGSAGLGVSRDSR